jgi:fermentation-respiration switch protein FrsA (DUF1100 family)
MIFSKVGHILREKDDRTPIFMSKKIYKMLKIKEKKLWVVKEAKHGGGNSPEFGNFEEWEKKTLSFFDKYLKK